MPSSVRLFPFRHAVVKGNIDDTGDEDARHLRGSAHLQYYQSSLLVDQSRSAWFVREDEVFCSGV